MVGSACWKFLLKNGFYNLIGKTKKELDLRIQSDVFKFIEREKPDVIIDSAAIVGGILANMSHPYTFLMDNMLIQNNLIDAALKNKTENFIFLGSSCIYPKFSKQPIKEKYLLEGKLEETNQWYATAKISGVKLIEAIRNTTSYNYLALMPTNMYGPNDNFDLESSHVIPALIKKAYNAKIQNQKKIILWGSGNPKREFMHVDDLASAVFFFLSNDIKSSNHLYNVGYGDDISIYKLLEIIINIFEFDCHIELDPSKPDGTPRKLLDSSRLKNLGWSPKVDLIKGLKATCKWYVKNQNNL